MSILPRSGGALGFTYIPPTNEDRYLLFIDELRGRLVTLLGGRAAEEIAFSGRISTGALDDIRRATDMAYKAVAEYGLNQTIGPVSIATLAGGGIDESGGAVSWGRDQVPNIVQFLLFFIYMFYAVHLNYNIRNRDILLILFKGRLKHCYNLLSRLRF